MGQKVHPFVQRVGFIKTWHSRWYAKASEYPKCIYEDFQIRKLIKKRFSHAAVSQVFIERLAERVKIRVRTARPGIVIGRHGADIERLRDDLNTILKREVAIDIEEVKNPGLEAQLVAENISLQLVKRVAFRRAVKRAMEQSMTAGAKGIRVTCSGRLNGAEMSRTEMYKLGKVPLQTLRADIDYGFAEAHTTYGMIGVKVWLYKGEVLPSHGREVPNSAAPASPVQKKTVVGPRE
ncbi:MAG: 30S ribosomal protein S3 [Candidatus Omnitrophica bacterium]|nr:30S ribosomal protein S3 [Candidatus Omnitrophota bacterium]